MFIVVVKNKTRPTTKYLPTQGTRETITCSICCLAVEHPFSWGNNRTGVILPPQTADTRNWYRNVLLASWKREPQIKSRDKMFNLFVSRITVIHIEHKSLISAKQLPLETLVRKETGNRTDDTPVPWYLSLKYHYLIDSSNCQFYSRIRKC